MMRSASPPAFILAPVARAARTLCWLCVMPLAWAQSPKLANEPVADSALPTFITGDKISGRPNLEMVVEGQAEVRRGDKALSADRIEYYQPDDTLDSQGNVRINASGNRYWGPALNLRMDVFEGSFSQPRYQFLEGGNGKADRIDFLGEKQLAARRADYTTCERDNEASWTPAWQFTGERFVFDLNEEVGTVTKPTVRFMDVPILHWPGTASFPLSDKRKSGFLPPTFGLDTLSGFSYTQPYYLDIAPNRDATLQPTLMTQRGLQLGGEYRYLEPRYAGTFRGEYLPGDALRGRDRWSYGLKHGARLDTSLAPVGDVNVALNLNRVSDDQYWRDFTSPLTNNTAQLGNLTQRLLPNDLSVSWGRASWTAGLRMLKWQTLQDPAARIEPPYDRLPQIMARQARNNLSLGGVSGLDWSLDADFTRFSALTTLPYQRNGDRLFSRAQLTWPWQNSAGFFRPKLQLHLTQYQFETALISGPRAGLTSASRAVPIFSLDSGLVFERDASMLGRSFIQTLEPRAFYVRTPYRDQSYLPNYDSGENSFNFASIYTENPYVGNDRIADANLLTLGVTSRLLDEDTGAESARVGIAQRVRFEDQRVRLVPGQEPLTERLSDVLVGGAINWTRAWATEATTQYNQKLRESERTTVGLRYNPSDYRVVSAAYRRQRLLSEQIDVAWQWPINDLWGDRGQSLGRGQGQGGGRYYSVGRLNYSRLDGRLVDTILGLEYDGCCWIGRVVLQRSQTGVTQANTKIMVQLEFTGFSRIGNNPLATLRNSIPRYQYLRDQVQSPSRFTQYD